MEREIVKEVEKLRFFNDGGKELYDDDIELLSDNQLIYFDEKGKWYLGREFENNTIIQQYKQIKILGEGGYGKVYLGYIISSTLWNKNCSSYQNYEYKWI